MACKRSAVRSRYSPPKKSTVLRWKCSAFLFASADADNAVRLALSTLKAEIAGALKTQLSNVALHKHSVVRTIYFEFHAVAAFHLKGRIIGRERMRHRIVRMGARNFRALCHNRCRNSQPRRMLFLLHVLIFPMMVYRIMPKTTRNRMGNRMLNSISNPA